jgi:acyl-CoA synthetase (NDP forming)
MDTDGLRKLLEPALSEEREVLFEHEVLDLLAAAGMATPARLWLPRGALPDAAALEALPGDRVVLKVVSEHVLHKSDVGGVRIVDKTPPAVAAALEEIYAGVPAAWIDWLQRSGKQPSAELAAAADLGAAVDASLRGVLLVEFVPYRAEFGRELLLGARGTREFGSVLTFGIGGTDAEYFASRLEAGRGHAIRSAELLAGGGIPEMLRQTAVHERLSGATRGSRRLISDGELEGSIAAFAVLVRAFDDPRLSCALAELEINPLVIADDGRLLPLDGLLRLGPRRSLPPARPVEKIGALLHPRSVALVGVSNKMNPGRIILQNLLDAGYPTERIFILKPGEDEIAGVRCWPDAASLPETVDLLVLAVSAGQVPGMLEEICRADCARAVIVIPGGIAEKEGGEAIQQHIDRVIAEARALPGGGPVINGSNCLGVYDRDAGVNTLFIPEYKLPRPGAGARSRIAYLSQSGAFMICRMSRITNLDPVYAVSYGNQMDLTLGDYLEHLLDDPEVDVVACYAEGFADGDGLKVARLAAQLRARGKHVLLYKAGRTAEGRSASAGHTASIAGDYETCRQVLGAAGVELLEIFEDFESRVRLLQAWGPPSGTRPARLAVVSNAGFECVGIADNLRRRVNGQEQRLDLAELSPATRERLRDAFVAGRIDSLVDVRNPLDLTPMASDAVWGDCLNALLDDPGVDAAIVAIVPLTAAMQTLPPGAGHREDLTRPEAIAARLAGLRQRTSKPFVVSIDSGRLYDPLVRQLEAAGLPVFRFADQATRFLGRYLG